MKAGRRKRASSSFTASRKKCRPPEEEKENRDPENWPFHSMHNQTIIKEGPNGEILLPPGMYEVLLDKRANHSNMAREIQLVKDSIIRIFKDSEPIYDPSEFRRFCSDAGAPNLFTWISSLMVATRRKGRRQGIIQQLTTNIISCVSG